MSFSRFIAAACGVLPAAAVLLSPASAQAADAAAGKKVFLRCAICHAVQPGVNKLGPSLAGIVGRKAGTVPKFNYSPAMKNSKISWTPAQLDAFLTKPNAVLPGNKMVFPGLPNPADRANVIAYMRAPN